MLGYSSHWVRWEAVVSWRCSHQVRLGQAVAEVISRVLSCIWGSMIEGCCSGYWLTGRPLFDFPSNRAYISLIRTRCSAVFQLLQNLLPPNRKGTGAVSSLEWKTQWQICEPACPFTTHSSEAQSHCRVFKSQHTLSKLSSQGNLVTTQAVQAAAMTGSQFS